METQALARNGVAQSIEQVLVGGDLSKLTVEQRVSYYRSVCESVGLNELTRPFDYLHLNGKLILYARKDATDQLRSRRNVAIALNAAQIGDLYVVTAKAQLPDGRTDEEIGAVAIAGLKGDALANAMMKATTKAKRRVTLSICGLGLLDESEIDSIPEARRHEEEPPRAPQAPNLPAGRQATPAATQEPAEGLPAGEVDPRDALEVFGATSTSNNAAFEAAMDRPAKASNATADDSPLRAECRAVFAKLGKYIVFERVKLPSDAAPDAEWNLWLDVWKMKFDEQERAAERRGTAATGRSR